MLSEADQELIDEAGFAGDFGRSMEFKGIDIYSTATRKLLRFYVRRGYIPELLDAMSLRNRISSMREHAGYIYLETVRGEDILVDASRSLLLKPAGYHEVEAWARGMKIEGERAYLLEGNELKIAQINPVWGWI